MHITARRITYQQEKTHLDETQITSLSLLTEPFT